MAVSRYVVAYSPRAPRLAHAIPVGEGIQAMCSEHTPHIEQQTPFPPTAGEPRICTACVTAIQHTEARLHDLGD